MSRSLVTRIAIGMLTALALVLVGCAADSPQPTAELTGAASEPPLPETLELTPPSEPDGALPEQTYLLVAFEAGSPGAAALAAAAPESDAFETLPAELRDSIAGAVESAEACGISAGDAIDGRLRLVLDCAIDETVKAQILERLSALEGVDWAEEDLRATIP